MTKQILGRQPVAIVAAIQAVLALLVSFDALQWAQIDSVDDVMLFSALLNAAAAVYLALGTTETLLAPVIELFKGAVSFGAIYGLNLTQEQSGLAVVAITAVFALVHQGKTSPQAVLATDGPVLVPNRQAGSWSRNEHGYLSGRGPLDLLVLLVVLLILVWLAVSVIQAL